MYYIETFIVVACYFFGWQNALIKLIIHHTGDESLRVLIPPEVVHTKDENVVMSRL